jgi:CRP/FNR family cyclic AMP-dependent transcriptional regulator
MKLHGSLRFSNIAECLLGTMSRFSQGAVPMSADIAMLAEVPLFALLDEQERATLAAILDTIHFNKGDIIFSHGDPADTLYVVRQGHVQVYVENDDGGRIIVGENERGDVFGELSFLDGGPRTATAIAVEDADLFVLDRGDLLEMITKHPHAAMDLLTVIGRRLRSIDELMRTQVSRNLNIEAQEHLTLGQRVADRVAAFGGSWPFITFFFMVMVVWIVVNSYLLGERTFDPYPYILLNLVLSMLAAIQAPVIMMSQNRQAAKDRIQADLDYQVNLKAEMEVAHLHRKVDRIQEAIRFQLTRMP